MRRRSPILAAALLTASVFTLAGPTPGASGESPHREWREVFSPDGSISRVLLPVVTDPPLTAQDAGAAAAAPVIAIRDTGPTAERFDVVIVGDGYTAAEADLQRAHAEARWSEIAATAPWSDHTASVNVWLVSVVSAESGVDNDPVEGVSRATALDMGFWCEDIERLLCLNEKKAQAYAAQAPAADAILAIGNTTKYGGAGYPSLATVAGGNDRAGRIAIHELGHSVGGLADEYWSPATTYLSREPSEPNVTRNPTGMKWKSYLGESTPDGGTIGAYEGGYYVEDGVYRPSENSLMRSLAKPFNLVGLDAMDRAIRARIGSGQ
ncbi:MAG TPA: M64 family metallopeptidase [Actinokineospora sp.]|nr:M64 family metallopeptidase [Actinokineospora sp.]